MGARQQKEALLTEYVARVRAYATVVEEMERVRETDIYSLSGTSGICSVAI